MTQNLWITEEFGFKSKSWSRKFFSPGKLTQISIGSFTFIKTIKNISAIKIVFCCVFTGQNKADVIKQKVIWISGQLWLKSWIDYLQILYFVFGICIELWILYFVFGICIELWILYFLFGICIEIWSGVRANHDWYTWNSGKNLGPLTTTSCLQMMLRWLGNRSKIKILGIYRKVAMNAFLFVF